MRPVTFTYDPADPQPLPHARARRLMALGRSVAIEGFTLGQSAEDRAFLESLAGATFKGRVRFEGCTFMEPLDLAEATFEQTLRLVDCTFQKGLKLRDASVAGRCSLRGSRFCEHAEPWLDWRGLTTGRDFSLVRTTFRVPINLYLATVGSDLRLDGVRILARGRTWELESKDGNGHTARTPAAVDHMDGKALNLWGATVHRNAIARPWRTVAGTESDHAAARRKTRHVRIRGLVDLGADVGGYVSFEGARVGAARDSIAVNFTTGSVGRSVAFWNGARITGSVVLPIRVGGYVDFNGSAIDAGRDRTAVNMNAARVTSSVAFRKDTRITGAIDLRASVGGQVVFDRASINASEHKIDRADHALAVIMDAATVGGSVFFMGGTHVIGAIDLRAKVVGAVEFSHAAIEGEACKTAVDMEAASIGGSVFFVKGTCVSGAINLRSKVEGQVEFNNATIYAETCQSDDSTHARTVNMDTATVGGPVFFRGDTAIKGTVSMNQAILRGGLMMAARDTTTEFDRPDMASSNDRSLRECLIVGDLDLSFVESGASVLLHGVSILGAIHARHITVSGDLHMCGGVAGAVEPAQEQRAAAWAPFAARYHREIEQLERQNKSGSVSGLAYRQRLDDLVKERTRFEREAKSRSDELRWQPWELNGTSRDSTAIAIDLELAHVRGHLWIKGQRVRGGVKANLAHVEGDASFDRSLIEGDLDLRGARVEGAFEGEPAAKGEPGPLVCGTIDARGGTFESVTIRLGDTPNTDGRVTKWYLFDSAKVGVFRVLGRLDAQGRKVFSVHRMGFGDLELDGLTGGGYPWWTERDEWRIGLVIILAFACFLALAFGAWPGGWWTVLVALATYLVIAGHLQHRAVKARRESPNRPMLDFLRRSRFSAAFSIDAERWARAGGDDPRADEIFLDRRRRELEERRPLMDADGSPIETGERPAFHWFTLLWRWCVLDFVFGYGVRPARAVHLFALLWLLNWAVFLPAAAVERPLSFETQAHEAGAPVTPANPAWPGDGGMPREEDRWGPQRAFFMAIRVQVPPVELFVDAEWKPADRPMFGAGVQGRGIALTYENWAAVMRILNLVLVPVIIAGATGLLKPREARYTGAS